MQKKLAHHLHIKFPFLKDAKILIAVSGGVDSVVLTHLFASLNYTISLAHCNFKLREKESDLDEEFVKNLGEKLRCNVFTTQFNTKEFADKHKQSTQIAARNLRYQWFAEIMEKYNFDYVLTAHHADDNLETFLINLTRGSGLDGLTGIPEINGTIIRPLLPFSREKIVAFAKENKLEWREDVSNASTKYTRNKIRHLVVPILKEINPSLLDSFANTITHLQESQQIVQDKMAEVANKLMLEDFCTGYKVMKIDIKKLQELPNPKPYIYQLLKNYNFTEWNDVYNLLSAQSGKQIFSKTHTLLKDRGFLIITKKVATTILDEIKIPIHQSIITHPILLHFKEVKQPTTKNKQCIYVDKNALIFPLKLRKWQNGDSFYPAGMLGKKKLSKYFKDEKFSLLDKQQTWLLCTNTNEIIWIIGHRQDSRFIITEKTITVLHIYL